MKVSKFLYEFDKYKNNINVGALPKDIKKYYKSANRGAKVIKMLYRFKSKNKEMPLPISVKAEKVLCFMRIVSELQFDKKPISLKKIKEECDLE